MFLKKVIRPSRKRSLVDDLIKRFGASFRQACAVLQLSRSVYYYQSVAQDQTLLAMRIKEITEVRVRYGYRRVHVMLQREGWNINPKRVYRLYSLQGLALRSKRPKRHRSAHARQPRTIAQAINEAWSIDFVSDALFDGRRLRTLTVLDNLHQGMPGHPG